MNIQLLERKCQGCGVKLTEFEVVEKEGYCMECYQDTVRDQMVTK
ncbi:hypothetical protein [Ammoniphilus sp. 3BR4]